MISRAHIGAFAGPIALIAVFSADLAAQTADAPAKVRVPVIAINAGRELGPTEVDAVIRGFDSPVIRDSDLAARFGFYATPRENSIESIKRSFSEAQDLFFSGGHVESRSIFERVVSQAASEPAIIAVDPACRGLIFKARIHLAAIEQGAGQEASADEQLRLAAAFFPELEPSPTDFPPWICERFASIKQQIGQPTGEIILSLLPDCSFFLSGRSLGQGGRFGGVAPGEYAAQVRCSDHSSPAQRLEVTSDAQTEFKPLILNRLAPEFKDGRLTFKVDDKMQTSSMIADLLAIASYGRWGRFVALIGRPADTEAVLIDSVTGSVLRQAQYAAKDLKAAKEAGVALVSGPPAEGTVDKRFRARPWYKDGLAWTAVGIGAALLGTGLYLGQVYGYPSRQEPWIRAMIAGGAGLAVTGVIVFFIPEQAFPSGGVEMRQKRPAVGAAVSIAF